ncbi:MAG: response regulator [Desulfobacterales bacterium]|nr:response regulator [Desulfobacterales bacterium]
MRNNIPVLLIEDDDVDAENVVRAFKKNKITNPLYITRNGEEALAFLRREGPYREPGIAARPGVMLLDLNMPRMNGIEFLRIVKADEDLKSIPVVVLTTSQEEKDRLESFKLSVAGYIIKPVDFKTFVEAVEIINRYWTLSELA